MTILREHKAITHSGELSLWTHTAFCITAALILSFEVMCDEAESLKERRIIYVNNIRDARRRLAERVNDVLAKRGVLLIDAVCPEADGAEFILSGNTIRGANAATISFEEIVARLTTDWAILGLSTEIQASDTSLVSSQLTFNDAPASGFQEFDGWFNHMFLGNMNDENTSG